MEAIISIAGSIIGSLAGKAAEYTVDPIAQQLSYLFKHKSKFQNLRTKVEELEDARERVQQSVHEANRNGEEIFGDVDRWLTVVNGKISEHPETQLQVDEEKAKKKCFVGLCPDFKSRYQLSKKAEKDANTIAELLKQRDRFDGVYYRSAPHLDVRPVKEYEAFESRSRALSGVMEALKDDNCNTIGVYGMGGVGKTTVVKEVAKQAKEKKLFDKVVFVPITQTPSSTVTIQDEIAEKSDLIINETNKDVRAARLREGLKKKGKVLIILDDIWVQLELNALGIPSRDEHKGCKILMTSRKLDVLQSMGSQKNLAIDILTEDEAWNLFKNIAGGIVERSDLQSTAIEVSQKCAGLPIAIATVAKALKHKENIFEWKNALRELGRPSKRNFKGIAADAYSAIELSYKFLEVEEHRLIFLLCSMMGHNAAIEDLLRCGMGLGLFRDFYTIKETRDKVLTLVSNLKASCLLLDGSNPKNFDMHGVVRDVAKSIASRDLHWLALGRDDVFEEWSDEKKMKNYTLISLQQYAKVSELLDHDQLECPNLTFFSISSEDSSLKIPNNFFRGMGRLKVLDFTKMHFSSLPLSMRFLKNIRTLCLSQCMLKDVVIIGELRNLEILNLRKSDIAMLPREIGQLTKLKLLDLSDCRDLQVIYPNVLSSLSRLEELYLYDSFDRWVIEGIDDPKSNASLVELQHLSHLTTLELHIPDEQAMPKGNLFSEKMERYKISIGMKWDFWRDRMETTRMLKLKINKSIHLYDEVKPLLRTTEYLHLNEGGFQSEATLLFDKEVALPMLQHLTITSIENLERLWPNQLDEDSFSELISFDLGYCNKLLNVFPLSMLTRLQKLDRLSIWDCNLLEEIFESQQESSSAIRSVSPKIFEFPKVTSLELRNLPKLKSFYHKIHATNWPSLKEMKVIGCNKVEILFASQETGEKSQREIPIQKSLFWVKTVVPTIEELILYSSSIKRLWHDQLPVMSCGVKNLTSLEVRCCHNLKNLFTFSIVRSFVQLKRLVVEGCEEIEEIIAEERIRKMVFPKLDYLELKHLANLKKFCSGNPIEFPFLRVLKIARCPVFTTFHCDSLSVGKNSSSISMKNTNVPKYLFNEKVALPMLKELYLSDMENLEGLWPNHHNVVFQDLRLTDCRKVKEIIEGGGDEDIEVKDEISFSQLNSSELIELSKLESFRSSENYTFILLSLKFVIVQDCPNMKLFSQGVSNAQILHKVRLK